MPDTIIMRLTTASEREFFRLIQDSYCVSLKHIYKKVCKKQALNIIKRLEYLQEHLKLNLLIKKAEFCKINGLPITNLYFNTKIEIKEFGNNETIVLISAL